MSRQVSDMSTAVMETDPTCQPSISTDERRQWMRLLALADAGRLERIFDALTPASGGDAAARFDFLRRPETGLAMVRGRTGGSGRPFNLGEMTVTRCVVVCRDTASGERIEGVACLQGRDHAKAVTAAKLDALCQDSALGATARSRIAAELGEARQAARARTAAKTAATKVEFFTMERGS